LYLFGTVEGSNGKEIRYARAESVTGPYVDKSGTALTDGSNGELLVSGTSDYLNPENPMRAFASEDGNYIYLGYNATKVGKETMASGYLRRPMFITPIPKGEDGWFTTTVTPIEGWATPRFQ